MKPISASVGVSILNGERGGTPLNEPQRRSQYERIKALLHEAGTVLVTSLGSRQQYLDNLKKANGGNEWPLERLESSFALGSMNADKRTVDMVLYSGNPVMRMNGWTGEKYTLQLATTPPTSVRMGRMNSGAPLLADHNSYSVKNQLGVFENAKLENGKLMATARFSNRADVTPLWQDIQDGIIRNVSVGAAIHKLKDTTPEDSKEPKSLVAVDWEPMEGSIVSVPADPNAGLLSAQMGWDLSDIEFEPEQALGIRSFSDLTLKFRELEVLRLR